MLDFFLASDFFFILTVLPFLGMARGFIETINLFRGESLNVGGAKRISDPFPMGEGWYSLRLRINEILVVGTGTTPLSEGELRFIKNIFLKTDRGEVICNLPSRALYKINTVKSGSPPRKDAIAAASATYRVHLEIPFADYRMARPEDTILDTKRYSSVSLEIQLGTVADLLGTVGTSTVTATFDCDLIRSKGLLPQRGQPLFHVQYETRPPVDASVDTKIFLERSADLSIKRLYAHESSAGTAGEPFSGNNADDVKDRESIRDNNGFIIEERIHEMIQDQNKDDYSLETVLAGMTVFDFVQDGSINSSLFTGDKTQLDYRFVNKAGVVANDNVSVAVEGIRTLK